MDERKDVIRLAVFGMPVTHSLSPVIHHHFASQCGIDVDYQAIECSVEEFDHKLTKFALAGGRGCNITVPLKHRAWQFAQRYSASVTLAQAANTLLFETADDCFADNTDGIGLVQDLLQHLSESLSSKRILILGAGGAAAGILGDLLQQGPTEVVIANRTLERARKLALRFTERGNLSVCSMDQLNSQQPFELVINATSSGHEGLFPAIPLSIFTASGLCYDLNYGRAAEPLRKRFEDTEISYQDGLGMLLRQAAASFILWTGKKPDCDLAMQQLRKEWT